VWGGVDLPPVVGGLDAPDCGQTVHPRPIVTMEH